MVDIYFKWGNNFTMKINLRKIIIFLVIGLVICSCALTASGHITDSKFTIYNNQHQVQNHIEKQEEQYTVPDCVEIGDILIMDIHSDESSEWKRPGLYNEHAALYIGGNYFIHAGIDLGNIVCIKNYSRFYLKAKNFAFLRVKTADQSTKQSAVDWALDRQGKKYQNFFIFPWFGLKIANPDKWNPTANTWYCMELVWAAYYNQGIDIDSTEWNRDPPLYLYPWVTGDDILADDDIEIIYEDVNDSIEIEKPRHGIYRANKKIISTESLTVVFGGIDVEVSIINPDRINRVEFYIDNKFKHSDNLAPYNWTWSELSFGKRIIKVVAFDNFGENYSTYITMRKFF